MEISKVANHSDYYNFRQDDFVIYVDRIYGSSFIFKDEKLIAHGQNLQHAVDIAEALVA